MWLPRSARRVRLFAAQVTVTGSDQIWNRWMQSMMCAARDIIWPPAEQPEYQYQLRKRYGSRAGRARSPAIVSNPERQPTRCCSEILSVTRYP
jgi:hypothetical protein